ncbi:GNAT family N-acetyltransferase [Streptomyces armeniacus]|uniref:GNAT family N-acetyltransferase n=1 Tax=Streptomyces armeniacus TaxID=83291 RepID=A0A345XQ60_9ACTN|nr:GNAT family N-acetyltransferase [Streptomyces armeniacus]AXK33776.1 GNAT family N-acetyltransferase [Streptomyces armeniacus]
MTDVPPHTPSRRPGRPRRRDRLTAALRPRSARSHAHAPPTPPDTGAMAPERPGTDRTTALWRMRTTVREEPGSLAALCTALADRRIDILTLQALPLGPRPGDIPSRGGWTVDELLLRAPSEVSANDLKELVAAAGGTHTWAERAVAHDLVDAPAQALALATRTALDSAELPLALRQLLGRCVIRSLPATTLRGTPGAEEVAPDGEFGEHRLRFPDPAGGALVVERHDPPFTPAEFARARALVELDARLGEGRVPRRREALALSEGREITVRRADTRDLEAARAMHERCSRRTLAMRYHGPVGDADRYLNHLLSPRFGRTLAAETASGRLVALGHLLWDGDETEVALLVEDAWQRRGVGVELLRRLVGMAAETRCEHVYAVTQASNAGMAAAMRALGLPLDHQVEEGTLVITAQLDRTQPERTPAPLPPAPEPADGGR